MTRIQKDVSHSCLKKIEFMKLINLLIISLISLNTLAQKGTIRGMVYDDANGESLVGVTVVLVGTTQGTITDLDGQFTIQAPPGTVEVQLSYISYNSLTINNVAVKAGEVTILDNLRLKESSMDLKEVVISAEVVRTTELALQSVKRKSAAMMDGISASRMALTGDATAVEAAKRVTGVSIEGGKYVYIRGLGDRYAKTTLNSVNIPGLDPDRNSLQLDLFPTNLINNMIVVKNFTAELPADFTGGLLDIETKDFPERKVQSISFSTAFNPAMHFNPDYLSYQGGATDFLGFDDGTRKLPAMARLQNVPTPISGAPQQKVIDFISSFNPELGAAKQLSMLDVSAGFSIGNQIELEANENESHSPKLGYIFSFSYKTDFKYYDDVQYGEYQRSINPAINELTEATTQKGSLGEYNVLIGALGGIAYKKLNSKYKLSLMHLQNGESRAGKFRIDNNGEAVGQSGYIAESDNLEYNQRSLSNLMLNGTHLLGESKAWEIDWRISPAFSISNDPDIRKTAFTLTDVDTLFMAGAGGNPTRIWRYLNEFNATAKLDINRKYRFADKEAKLRFGASHVFKQRFYEILFFDIQFFGSQQWDNPDPSTVLSPENLYPNRPNGIYYQSGNNQPNPNEYSSNIHNSAFYVSNEMYLTEKLKSVIGLRAEYFVQRHTGRDQRYASGDLINGRNLENDIVLESIDLFPSINFIYSQSEMQNWRVSYSRTIARPSFKELSFAQILDPISNRIFNGSLFSYSDWDGALKETRIDNFDLRWELFQERDQLFSVSAFFKQFDSPIELVRIPEQQTSTEYQPRNVGDGRIVGVEVELRKELSFVSPFLYNWSLNTNLTFVESAIEMTTTEYNSRKAYEKIGEEIGKTRQMAGQSPYVINAGISYQNQERGINAGIFYNVKGPTLAIVGAGLFPDIYMEPFHGVNISFQKLIGEKQNSAVEIKIANLLGDMNESYYSSYGAENQIYSLMNPGRTISLGWNYKF
jgi:TonB-dependent receptor